MLNDKYCIDELHDGGGGGDADQEIYELILVAIDLFRFVYVCSITC